MNNFITTISGDMFQLQAWEMNFTVTKHTMPCHTVLEQIMTWDILRARKMNLAAKTTGERPSLLREELSGLIQFQTVISFHSLKHRTLMEKCGHQYMIY
jgi:hypothetical protein